MYLLCVFFSFNYVNLFSSEILACFCYQEIRSKIKFLIDDNSYELEISNAWLIMSPRFQSRDWVDEGTARVYCHAIEINGE